MNYQEQHEREGYTMGESMKQHTDEDTKIKQSNTYGIGKDFMISQITISKTTFIVSSYFGKGKSFVDVMGKIIEYKIKAS